MAGMRYQPYGLARLDGQWRNAFTAVFNANRDVTSGARLWSLESFTTMGAAAQVDLANNQVTPIGVPVTPSWTLLMVLARHTAENTYPYILGLSGAANAIAFTKAHPDIGGRAGWYDGVNLLDSGFNIYLGEIATISLSYDGATNRYTWTKNGQLCNSTIGAYTGGGVWQFAAPLNDGTITHIPLIAFGKTATADDVAMSLTAQPWQIFEAFEDDWADNSTVAIGDTSLTGSASIASSASGTLTTQVRLTGAAAAVVAASGALSTSIALTGAAVARASAAGALSTSIALTGAAALQVAASGSLAAAGAALTGAAALQVSASGALTTQVRLSGAAALQMAAAGTLAGGGASLSGAAVLQVSAAGVLSTSLPLTGAAQMTTALAGSLAGSSAALSGGAVMQLTSTGSLTTQIRLAGGAVSIITAAGSLNSSARVGRNLAADYRIFQRVGAQLAASYRIAGAVRSDLLATYSILGTVDENAVAAPTRTVTFVAAGRTVKAEAVSRTVKFIAMDRTVVIQA